MSPPPPSPHLPHIVSLSTFPLAQCASIQHYMVAICHKIALQTPISLNIGDIITILQPNLSHISLNIRTSYHTDLWRTASVVKKKIGKKHHFLKQKVSHFWGSLHELAIILSSNIQ